VSFDTLARWYRTLEWIAFGDDLQRSRITCLSEVVAPRRALIVGEGNGRFLCELLRRHLGAEVDCIDASQRMLQLARKRLERELPEAVQRVRFLQHDLTSWSPPEHHYDLVATHFFLDCFAETQLAAIVGKLAQAATENANWLLADFSLPAQGVSRLHARVWLAVMYQFFRLTAGIAARQLIDPTPLLRSEGFALAQRHSFRKGMLKSEMWRRNQQALSSAVIPSRADGEGPRNCNAGLLAPLRCRRPRRLATSRKRAGEQL
jgi:ubiquinone/menaquinone biosynthesis C-methylase UbiE